MKYQNELKAIINSNTQLMQALKSVQRMDLKQGCIAAGAIRNLVWSTLMNQPILDSHDVDVVFFDDTRVYSDNLVIEAKLQTLASEINWEVKNEFYMNTHNNLHTPKFKSVADALAHFPETATAVGIYLDKDNQLQVVAPYGLEDLFELKLQPTPVFQDHPEVFIQRVETKQWLMKWPQLKLNDN